MTRVLSVASECAPLVKTGGLADVVGALPAALAPLGVTMRTLLPGYRAVMEAIGRTRTVLNDGDLFGGPARVLATKAADLDLLVIDAPHLYGRDGAPYTQADGQDWPDNAERFAALCWIAAEIAGGALKNWQPDILHCHDWQAGLAPLYLRERQPRAPVGTVLTIHNIAFQGLAPAEKLTALRLPRSGMQRDGFEYWDQISALKAGLVAADRITTVSPTYAAELMTPEFGMGLDGVLRERRDDLTGILNGVDLQAWSPPYEKPVGKAKHRRKLLKAMELAEQDGPVCIVISRLTGQKGMDILIDAMPRLLDGGGQLVVLGTGEAWLEEAFTAQAEQHPNLSVRIGFDEDLARLMLAGGDAIVVPSRFEPCGLTQLYGLRYGTVPVVAYTGGLADTVIPATPAGLRAGAATGLQFHPIDADALSRAFDRLCDLYKDRDMWLKIQKNAMRHPVGWDQSAQDYAALYTDLIKRA